MSTGRTRRSIQSIRAVSPSSNIDINEGVGITQDAKALRTTQDTLHVLAANTDGRAIVNRNDLAAGMKQIIRDSSGYYLLGYNSTAAPTDGKFHAIKVNVKRRGVDVRARKGYWAYTLDDVARANAPKKPEAPTAVMTALDEPRRACPRSVCAFLDRHRARRERHDARDVFLGTGSPRARPARGTTSGAGGADRDRARAVARSSGAAFPRSRRRLRHRRSVAAGARPRSTCRPVDSS